MRTTDSRLCRRSLLAVCVSSLFAMGTAFAQEKQGQRPASSAKVTIIRNKTFHHKLLPGPGYGYVNCKFYRCAIRGVPGLLNQCEIKGCLPGRQYFVRVGDMTLSVPG